MQFYNDYSEIGKKHFRRGIAVFLAGLILVSFAVSFSYFVEGKRTLKSSEGSFQISVSGEGKVAAKPDIATLSATIVTERATVSQAQAENTAASAKVSKFLQSTGIDSKDIKTTNYSIHPQYFYPENRKPQITGYQIRNSMEIKIRDLLTVDDVLGGLVENGANEIGNVSFVIEDPDKLKEEARKLAIMSAKEKASVLSKSLRVRLERIVGFSENDGGFPPPIFYRAEAFSKGADGITAVGPELSGGEQEISVSVAITYDFVSW